MHFPFAHIAALSGKNSAPRGNARTTFRGSPANATHTTMLRMVPKTAQSHASAQPKHADTRTRHLYLHPSAWLRFTRKKRATPGIQLHRSCYTASGSLGPQAPSTPTHTQHSANNARQHNDYCPEAYHENFQRRCSPQKPNHVYADKGRAFLKCTDGSVRLGTQIEPMSLVASVAQAETLSIRCNHVVV